MPFEDGRTVDRAIFGWPTVLASEGENAWKKLIPQALIAQERVITYGQDGEQLLAQLDEAGLWSGQFDEATHLAGQRYFVRKKFCCFSVIG
jgi:hypothetical protein